MVLIKLVQVFKGKKLSLFISHMYGVVVKIYIHQICVIFLKTKIFGVKSILGK